jgi:hypothetical protein
MKTKIAITFAFLFSISAIVKSQSTQTFTAATTKDSNNPTWRFVGNTRYLMLNPAGETHLYQLDSSPSKKAPAVKQYYFSRGMGDIQKLTLANIKNAFAGDLNFHEALDAEFTSDEELTLEESLSRMAALFEMRDEGSLQASENVGQNNGL